MRSLQDEWISEYPVLIDFTALLKQRPKTFALDMITREHMEEFCLDYAINNYARTDLLSAQARAVADGVVSWQGFLFTLMHVFYLTGIIGLKTETFEAFQWAHHGTATITADTINSETSVSIHAMFYRVLGIRP